MDKVGGQIKTLTAFTPRAISGEVAHNGDVVNRKDYESAVYTIIAGDYTSTPTAIDVACKVQDCATATGSFADITGATARISGEVSTVRNQIQELSLDLRPCAQYVKLVVTPDFTAGTAPTLFIAATIVLGEPRIMPAL